MEAREFAAGYPTTLPPHQIHNGKHLCDISEAQDWSYDFGRMLHARLNDTEPETLRNNRELTDYSMWAHGFYELEDRVLGDPIHGIPARNEINFHAMNRLMLGMWEPILNGYWTSHGSRMQWVNKAQDALAFEGMRHYRAREHFVRDVGSHALFEQGADVARKVMTGVAQEYDTAIILLDFVRHNPDISVVPAPLQFERSNNRNRNVDFVVVNFKEQRAVGVQVKTAVKTEDFQNADQERVVFVDGTVDLGNVRVMRTQKGRSTERVVPWAGIIAAKRVNDIKTHGKSSARQFASNSRMVIQDKMEARHLVGALTVDYRDIANRIGERIMAKL